MKDIRIESRKDYEIAADDEVHRLVFGGGNLSTVVHLSDPELTKLRQVVNDYQPTLSA